MTHIRSQSNGASQEASFSTAYFLFVEKKHVWNDKTTFVCDERDNEMGTVYSCDRENIF
jgi:hypothetical protein